MCIYLIISNNVHTVSDIRSIFAYLIISNKVYTLSYIEGIDNIKRGIFVVSLDTQYLVYISLTLCTHKRYIDCRIYDPYI